MKPIRHRDAAAEVDAADDGGDAVAFAYICWEGQSSMPCAATADHNQGAAALPWKLQRHGSTWELVRTKSIPRVCHDELEGEGRKHASSSTMPS